MQIIPNDRLWQVIPRMKYMTTNQLRFLIQGTQGQVPQYPLFNTAANRGLIEEPEAAEAFLQLKEEYRRRRPPKTLGAIISAFNDNGPKSLKKIKSSTFKEIKNFELPLISDREDIIDLMSYKQLKALIDGPSRGFAQRTHCTNEEQAILDNLKIKLEVKRKKA